MPKEPVLALSHISTQLQHSHKRSHIRHGAETYVIAFQLEGFELQGDAVLHGSHHLPDTVLVCGVLLRPSGTGDGAV